MNEGLRHRLAAGAVLVGVAVLIAIGWSERDRTATARVGESAPAYAAPDLAGDTVSLAGLRGNVVLLNVWATWCAPCLWEMPALERAHAEFADRGLTVVAVSVDAGPVTAGAGADPVRRFTRRHGLTLPVLRDPTGRIQEIFGVVGLPTTFLIDRAGRIRDRVLGPAHWDRGEHRERIRQLLEE